MVCIDWMVENKEGKGENAVFEIKEGEGGELKG